MTNWADDIQDYEYPDPDDGDDDATETIQCPECHDSIYAESITGLAEWAAANLSAQWSA